MKSRAALMARLADAAPGGLPEILIIGGGINGVGVYRDLALQGVPALLAEAGDFSGGTSAAPSRLIHGGLRYLETGEAALVRESVEERNLLLLNAPHVVKPLPCWVPLQSWTGGTLGAVLRFFRLKKTPGRKGALAVKAGLVVYDLFGNAHRTMPKHRMLSRARARDHVPALSPATCAVAEYYDAKISHPERLVAELIADAEADCPASLAIPYLAAGALADGQVALTDRMTGEVHHVTPKLVVNMSGAWADQVQAGLGFQGRMIGGTKGSHLVIRHARLAAELGDTMLYFETEDHRACLIYRMEEDRLLLGTTDIRTEDPTDMTCSEAEIDYLFAVLAKIVPNVRLTRDDICFAYAGVRPLPRSDASVAGAISRDHKLHEFEPGPGRPFPVLTLIGGKWTTYRACAAQITDAVLKRVGAGRRSDTTRVPVGGGRDYPAEAAAQADWAARIAAAAGLPAARVEVLAGRYGSGAEVIARAEVAANTGPLAHLPAYSAAEIAHIVREERVTRLEDIVLRRTLIGFEGRVSEAALAELADIAAPLLGWDAATRAAEIAGTADLLRRRHRMEVAPQEQAA